MGIRSIAVACALVAVVALEVAACSSGGSGQGNAGGVPQEMCFAKATSSEGYDTLTFQVLGVSDCSNIADNFGMLENLGGYQFTPNTGSATGTEICSGTVGNYVVNVYNPKGGAGTICTDAGLPVVP